MTSIERSGVFTCTVSSKLSHRCTAADKTESRSASRYFLIEEIASALLGASPSRKTTSISALGLSDRVVCSAAHGSIAAPALAYSGLPSASAAGLSSVPLRPRNSVRSAVHDSCWPHKSANAIRLPYSVLKELRASTAWVSGSISVTMYGADAPREVPSTHSTYAVIDKRRTRVERFRIFSREILIESSSGTYCVNSSEIPCEVCSKTL